VKRNFKAPVLGDELSVSDTVASTTEKGSVKGRAILLGMFLAILFSAVNGYLSINLGMSFGYGAVAVLLAYSFFHRLGGGSSRRELSFVLISSVSTLGIYQSFSLIIYMLQTEADASFPLWMAPPKEAVLAGSLDLGYWITPIAMLMFTIAMTAIVGVVFTYMLREEFIGSKRMIWPSNAANASLVDACMTGGGSAKLVGVAALIGFSVTLLQNIPSFWGYDLTMVDLSPLLPRGALFAISLSVAFTALGYMISVKTSLSLMAAGLMTNLLIAPYLLSIGFVEHSSDIMAYYNELLFKFSIGPALGILLLGGILLSVFMLVRSRFSKDSSLQGADAGQSLGYLDLYKVLVRKLISNRKYLVIVLSIACISLGLAWFLNPFSPLPRVYSLLITAYIFFIGSFIEFVLIAKMAGETGMSMGVMSIFLYEIPIFGTGYRNYAGYAIYPFFRPSPWVSSGILPYLKYHEQYEVSWRDIMKAKIVGWAPTMIFSVLFTLVLWKYVGFGTPMMPAVSLIQGKVYLTMMATGRFVGTTGGIFPIAFVAGGIIGALLEVFTPVSMMGLGMGMLLPPHYIFPFGLGGVIRWYTDRRYGKEFYHEKGRLIVTGLMASSLIVQVIMTVLTNFM
jgi:hypothetical protein